MCCLDPVMQRLSGEVLVQMGVKPFNVDPRQNIIEASVDVDANGVQGMCQINMVSITLILWPSSNHVNVSCRIDIESCSCTCG